MYNYVEQRHEVFLEENQDMFLSILTRARYLLNEAGAAQLSNLISDCGGGSSWTMLACVDRVWELKIIKEIPSKACAAQERVFIRGIKFT
jgi:hypothetical protein